LRLIVYFNKRCINLNFILKLLVLLLEIIIWLYKAFIKFHSPMKFYCIHSTPTLQKFSLCGIIRTIIKKKYYYQYIISKWKKLNLGILIYQWTQISNSYNFRMKLFFCIDGLCIYMISCNKISWYHTYCTLHNIALLCNYIAINFYIVQNQLAIYLEAK